MPIGWAIVIVVQWLAIITLAAVVLGVLRQTAPHLERLARSPMRTGLEQGPPVGRKLPPFTGRDGSGALINVGHLLDGPAVFVFLTGTCAPCVSLADEIGVSDLGELGRALIIVTDQGDYERLRLPSSIRVLIMSVSEVSEVFAVRGRPFAIVTGADGTVRAKQGLNTVAHLRELAGPVVLPLAASGNAG